MKHLEIEIGRHSFKITLLTQKLLPVIESFNKQYQTYRKDFIRNRVVVVKDKIYLVTNEIFKEYYYPITALRNFAIELRQHGFNSSDVNTIYKDKPKRFRVDFEFIFKYDLRDYQKKYVRTMTASLKKNHTFLVDLQTGKGKGVIACKTIADIGYRTAFLILPKYIEKWTKELHAYFKLKKSDIFIVRGGDTLMELMNMSQDELPKFIIFSNRTMYFYIKEYETLQFKEHFKFPVMPNDLLDHLNVSILVIDEAHQEFHSGYKTTIALDPTLLIGLSATLQHKDKKINRLYELLYPKETRLSFLALDKYQHVYAVRYNLPLNRQFKYMQGGYGYSQTRFEQSILKQKHIKKLFKKMFLQYVEEHYVKRRQKGDKCILFFGSIDMCNMMVNVLNHQYKKLKIRRYVTGDSYDQMMKGDIIVSTPGSSGTALDIPGLITVLSGIATNSTQLNLQMLGRLRKLENREVRFVYFYCAQIDQHVRYHRDRVQLFSDRVEKLHQEMYMPR